jgi:hypothetical protein
MLPDLQSLKWNGHTLLILILILILILMSAMGSCIKVVKQKHLVSY